VKEEAASGGLSWHGIGGEVGSRDENGRASDIVASKAKSEASGSRELLEARRLVANWDKEALGALREKGFPPWGSLRVVVGAPIAEVVSKDKLKFLCDFVVADFFSFNYTLLCACHGRPNSLAFIIFIACVAFLAKAHVDFRVFLPTTSADSQVQCSISSSSLKRMRHLAHSLDVS
jgi:hypothetical protein